MTYSCSILPIGPPARLKLREGFPKMGTHLAAKAMKILPERATVTDFFQLTLDSLLAHIAILQADGTIIAVNAAWDAFATQNGLVPSVCGPGVNYLEVCEQATGPCSEESRVVANGIRDVVRGKVPDFQLEYPCHSPTEQRWFTVRVTRFVIDGRVRIVVTHDNITERKSVEIQLREANRRLEVLATTDGLTGVSNRRQFDQTLAHEWKRHIRSRLPLSVLLMDIDYFKQYNDARGHIPGDECLKDVARTAESVIRRPGDLVARYGGEEFAVILPETDHAGSLAIAGLMADGLRLKQLPHPASEAGPFVTMSIGCATMVPLFGSSPSEILHRADQALYQAKTDGRNRIQHAG